MPGSRSSGKVNVRSLPCKYDQYVTDQFPFDFTAIPSSYLKLMQKRISLLLILAFLASAVATQQKVRDRPEGTARGAGAAQRKLEEAQRRAQVIDILKGVVESAADIQETRTRVAVLTSALDLLWKHDEAYARANFTKSAAALSDWFAADTTQRQERSEIRASMGVLLNAFARHDPQAAARLLDKFQKLLEEVLKGNSLSPNERLSLAQASLDSDAVQFDRTCREGA